MRNVKYVMVNFLLYDRTGISQFLEKQAEKGWILDQVGNSFWKFSRCQPQKLHFAVTYFPDASQYDPAPGEKQTRMQEFCAYAGWRLVGSNAQLQIFCNEMEDPIPIVTEPIVEIHNIHRGMKKSFLPCYIAILAMALLGLGYFVYQVHTDLISTIVSSTTLGSGILFLTLLITAAASMAQYFCWRRKALAEAERDGTFAETKTSVFISIIIPGLGSLIWLALCLYGLELSVILIGFAVILVILAAGFAVRKYLKSRGADRKVNRAVTMIAVFLLSMVIFGILPVIGAAMADAKGEQSEPPVTIEMLTGEQGETCLYLKKEKSVLAERCQTYLCTEEQTLQYRIVDVKVPALYELCLASEFDLWKDWYRDYYGTEAQQIMTEIDAEQWGADTAYRVEFGEDSIRRYVLCYGDRLVTLMYNGDLTPQQRGIVGEILNSNKIS